MANYLTNPLSKLPTVWRQLLWLALLVVVAIFLMGGSLIKPETATQAQREDCFVGFHVVAGQRNQDRANWVEYGQTEIEIGEFGALQIPDLVLFGEYQPETGEWIFPGMPGDNAFYTVVDVGEDGLSTGYKGLDADVEIAFSTSGAPNNLHAPEDSDAELNAMVDESRDSITLSGTVYLPAQKGDVYVTYYRVYETKDGRIYLDGSGNSSSSDGDGGGFGMSSTEEKVVTVNGVEEYTVTRDIQVQIEFVHPCISLTMLEYNAENECIASTQMAAETQSVTLQQDTIWCVVQETDAAGAKRQTALSIVDMWEDRTLYHGFVVKSADEIIQANHLDINVP